VTCRRAYEIDIAAYLADPRAAEHAGFRAHYPSCAACAAEVRAWTELAERLGGGATHPEPALLLRYEEAPDRLDAVARDAVRAHLARCASCRDELVGLRTFGPALMPHPADRRPARTRAGFAAALRGLLWQPAFAYAVLFAVLAPLVYVEMTRERPALRPAKPEPAVPARSAAPPADRSPAAPAPEPAAPPAPRETLGIEVQRREQLRALGYVADPEAGSPGIATEPPALRTDAGGVKIVTVSLDPGAGASEVRIESADGARSLSERFAAGTAAAELRLPADWPAGDYRVLVRSERGAYEAGKVLSR
jgi:hypothetical protein